MYFCDLPKILAGFGGTAHVNRWSACVHLGANVNLLKKFKFNRENLTFRVKAGGSSVVAFCTVASDCCVMKTYLISFVRRVNMFGMLTACSGSSCLMAFTAPELDAAVDISSISIGLAGGAMSGAPDGNSLTSRFSITDTTLCSGALKSYTLLNMYGNPV